MLFKDDLPKICINCLFKKKLTFGDDLLCKYNGVVSPDFSCKKFEYDVFTNKRKKKRELDVSKFSEKDFEL